MPKKISQRPRDPRHTAQLTGRRPLRYDRHGDYTPDDYQEHDPMGLVGGRWLAHSNPGEVRRG